MLKTKQIVRSILCFSKVFSLFLCAQSLSVCAMDDSSEEENSPKTLSQSSTTYQNQKVDEKEFVTPQKKKKKNQNQQSLHEIRKVTKENSFSINEESDEKNPLINKDDFKDASVFLAWVENDLLKEKKTLKRQIGAKVLGNLIGVAGSVVFFNLGSELADQVLKNKVFSTVTGVTSAIPIAILGSQFCSDIFSALVTLLSQEEKNINEPRSGCKTVLRRTVQVTEGVIAIISAAPITYLTHINYKPLIGKGAIALDVPAFIAKGVSDYWAMDTTLCLFSDFIKETYIRKKYRTDKNSVQYKRIFLSNSLKKVAESFKDLSDNEAKNLLSQIKNKEEDEIKRLNYIFGNAGNDISSKLKVPEEVKWPWGRMITGAVGSVIGAFSSVCLVPLAEESMSSFFKAVGISSPVTDKIGGWIAGVAAGSLMTYASKESFEKFYDFFASLPVFCKKKEDCGNWQCRDILQPIASVGSVILGAYSAAPQVYLSEKYFGSHTPLQIFTLVCAAVGPFAMDFWAIDNFFQRFIKTTGAKEQLLSLIHKIEEKIFTIEPRIIKDIYEKVRNNEDL